MIEVRWRVITIKHRHDDPEESTDLRQGKLLAKPS
jgi:hypothetical protein